MKYCLSGRQNKKYLTIADEIFVKSQDYRQISDLFIEHSDKMIILEINNDNINNEDYMKVVEQYAKSSDNFCCCIYNLKEINWFKTRNIKFYYGYPINNYYDMQALIALQVEYIKITAPLTFDMKTLKNFKMKFRMVPNVAYDAYIPRQNGICGQWIRPEDVQWYEEGIYIFEFEDADLEKERTLHHIYAETGIWGGNLNLLITNLNVNADNRIFSTTDFGKTRANCGQKCMQNNNCHLCTTAFLYEKTLRQNKKDIQEMIDKANLSKEN